MWFSLIESIYGYDESFLCTWVEDKTALNGVLLACMKMSFIKPNIIGPLRCIALRNNNEY